MPILKEDAYQEALRNAFREKEVIREWRELANINSFAYKLLNTGIQAVTALMTKIDYHNYSGIVPGDKINYLGKFFHLARFVDGDSTTTRKKFFTDAYLELDGKPISEGPFGTTLATKTPKVEFDQKPWTQNWSNVAAHIKGYIDGKWALGDAPSISGNISNQIFSSKTNKPTSAGNIPHWYDQAPQTSKESEPFSRLDLLKCIAAAGSLDPINQAQVGNAMFIRGYLMNQLVTETSGGPATDYYGTATGNHLGLLSGPSGTTKRFWGLVSNFVREGGIKQIDPKVETELKVFSAALCACALSSPYDNHSFYEIITVIDPADKLNCNGSLKKFNSDYYETLSSTPPTCFATLDQAIASWSRSYKWGPGSGADSCQIKK